MSRIIRLYNTSTKASNHMMVGAVLESRGFQWKPVKVEKVQSKSESISFKSEWNTFISRIASITKTTPKKTMMDEKLSWKHFANVISPDLGHETEEVFSSALFEALRTSLTEEECVERNDTEPQWIALKNSPVRFGRGISRDTLGFPEEYALSQESKSYHGCFVMGTRASYPKPYQNVGGSSDDGKGAEAFWYNDMTAVVEIKLDKTSCKSFSLDSENFIVAPNLKKKRHGPIGQAIFYTMDVWHCLARRGQGVMELPIVLLAGKSSKKIDMDQVCCLEAQIAVPEYCGDAFTYSVNRIVSFNGTTGVAPDEAISEDIAASLRDSRDKRAMAIYIRTLRIGLEHAVEIVKNRSQSNTVSPVSLCCRRLLPGESFAQLIASPIPREDHQCQSGLRISQGEIFQVISPTKENFFGLTRLLWFVDILPKHCLVKVSCASVHNTFINHADCNEALNKLHLSCMNNGKLKQELSEVLLGFCRIGRSETLVTIMKDLQAEENTFTLLDHQVFQEQGKLPQLWAAFCVLVNSLLLPMADVNVIHLDIRSNKKHTYNILLGKNPTGYGESDDGIVLRLIDYDSLIISDSTSGSQQDHAVYWDDLRKVGVGDPSNFAHRYLLWQVLWIAYTWYPPSPSVALDTLQKETNAGTFLLSLFNESYYLDFKIWLGVEAVAAVKSSLMCETISTEIINETLGILKIAFRKNANA